MVCIWSAQYSLRFKEKPLNEPLFFCIFKYYLNNILVNVLYYNFLFKNSLFLVFNMTNLFNGD